MVCVGREAEDSCLSRAVKGLTVMEERDGVAAENAVPPWSPFLPGGDPSPFPPSLSTASTALPQGMLLTSAAKLSL